ncbi:MAG: ABC transporter permease [Geminicoccaceae bacterium]|nr:ABC transporter permease [Geminicoccaceae bacterium]MCS7266458.1 ABC transporter permease [Geminicoccaceae bacterium]MCX7630930.1 ABC transporter permease [Geminicoccaceae bacterium]MDW8123946.1 ABC transporter permease [Geminicoccaceae bacterium]MDW8339992.1 ABC transporter permease [Geminicoccaceae bacterium]
MIDLEIVVANLPLYVRGTWTTLWLTFASLALGLVVAVPLGLARTSRNPLINYPVWLYTYFFRGTPLLVQLFMIYYGAGQFAFVRESSLWPLFSQAWFCALLAFTLNTAAYTAEIVRGAILATPVGEIEAARALGMSRRLVLRRIVLPSAFRRALPAYGNEMIFMLHGSAVASTVTIVDLTAAARIVNSRYYSPYEAFLTAALFYMALTFAIVGLVKLLERRWHAHLRPLAP